MSEARNDQSEDLVTRAVAAVRQLPLPSGPSAAIMSANTRRPCVRPCANQSPPFCKGSITCHGQPKLRACWESRPVCW